MANEYEKLSQMCLKQKKYVHDVGYWNPTVYTQYIFSNNAVFVFLLLF